MGKSSTGRFFEDYRLGDVIHHAVPRTISGGERALYHALYPARHALTSSDVFARNCGFPASPLDELLVFHVVFGKTVPDVSLNAVANLGYAELRFLKPVYPGITIRATSEVIGLKENSNGKTGIVWVRTTGFDERDEPILDYVRWVMLRKGDVSAPAPEPVVPELKTVMGVEDLNIPAELRFAGYDYNLAGEAHRWGDYAIGETIDHLDQVTVEEADHILATRTWQNTSRVHFDVTARVGGDRLVYGGHVISLARALSFNGLANAQLIAGINGGTHANPCTAGMTVSAWSEVLDKAETGTPGVGALRLRLVATTGDPFVLKGEDGRHLPTVLLDLDYWALIPI